MKSRSVREASLGDRLTCEVLCSFGLRFVGLTLVGLLFTSAVQAHTKSTGYASLDASSKLITYRLSVTPSELGEAATDLMLAVKGDVASSSRIAAWLRTHVSIAVDDVPCKAARSEVLNLRPGDDRIVLALDVACTQVPGRLTLNDRLTAQFGEHYRSIVSVTRADATREERVLDSEHKEAVFELGKAAPSGLPGFVWLGAEHMLSGLDHLLFLAALLVGSRGLKGLLLAVTAFTLAHSLSLAASVLDYARVSPALVEPLIAASIIWVAAENIWFERHSLRRYVLAFGFGLIHGLAFAEGLRELKLAGWPLARALFGFNLGVELAQALLVVLLAPLIAWLATLGVGRRWQRGASLVVALFGVFWLLERTVL